MEWYLPITILPGIGMMILSTVQQLLALSGEIHDLPERKLCSTFEMRLYELKMKQLSRLTRAMAMLYCTAGSFVFSGILGFLVTDGEGFGFSEGILYFGTLSMLGALILLIIYSFRAVVIRRIQFERRVKD